MIAEIKLKKWGNSYGIRIPNSFVKELEIGENSKIALRIVKDKLLIEKVQNLQDLCSAINENNLNTQSDWLEESVSKEW